MTEVGRAKIGRNDPCPCGSGKKFKRCHLPARIPTAAIVGAVERFEQTDAEARDLGAADIFVQYVLPVVFLGQKVWSLGDQLKISKNRIRPTESSSLKCLFISWVRNVVSADALRESLLDFDAAVANGNVTLMRLRLTFW